MLNKKTIAALALTVMISAPALAQTSVTTAPAQPAVVHQEKATVKTDTTLPTQGQPTTAPVSTTGTPAVDKPADINGIVKPVGETTQAPSVKAEEAVKKPSAETTPHHMMTK